MKNLIKILIVTLAIISLCGLVFIIGTYSKHIDDIMKNQQTENKSVENNVYQDDKIYFKQYTTQLGSDRFEHNVSFSYYEDFDIAIDTEYKIPDGNLFYKYMDKITIDFTPKNTGSYLVDGWLETKAIIVEGQPRTEQIYFFHPVQDIFITYSNGNKIERTGVKVPCL